MDELTDTQKLTNHWEPVIRQNGYYMEELQIYLTKNLFWKEVKCELVLKYYFQIKLHTQQIPDGQECRRAIETLSL